MDLVQAILLALVQGITEFLPISSSAHLILPSQVLGWPDQGLAFDTAVHLGSLVAVLTYFRHDIAQLVAALWRWLTRGEASDDSRFAINLAIASLPIIPVGFLLRYEIETYLRTTPVIIVATVVFGLLLLFADRMGREARDEKSLDWKQALMIGFSQCLALVPGTSRSGITMTAALLGGFTRQAASRISFLIAIPTIAGAATLKLVDLATSPDPVNWTQLLVGGGVAMVSAYACIYLFLDFIDRIGFLPVVIYRLLLGAVLLLVWL